MLSFRVTAPAGIAAPAFCTMPVAAVPPRIVTWLPETTMPRSRLVPHGPEPRVRDWIAIPFTLFATVLSRTWTFDDVLTLIPPPSHSEVPDPRPVPKPLPLTTLLAITPLRPIS